MCPNSDFSACWLISFSDKFFPRFDKRTLGNSRVKQSYNEPSQRTAIFQQHGDVLFDHCFLTARTLLYYTHVAVDTS